MNYSNLCWITLKIGIGEMVKSPCIGKCNYNSTLEKCNDCNRTKEEISTWYIMSDDEKLNVIERISNENCNGK
jgi:predicted Fe-S protein YdhL (DUF1289 family)